VRGSHRLEPRLIQAHAVARLRCRHEPAPDESREVIGDRRPVPQLERRKGRVRRVVAGELAQNRQEHRLAVGARPPAPEDALFADLAGEAVANGPADVFDELGVASEDLIEEAIPARAGGPQIEAARASAG
jgi:hypothetical protein